MTIKEAYSTQEIREIFALDSHTRVTRRAKREGWQSRPRSGQGGGFEWLVASMPEITRTVLQVAEVAQLTAANAAVVTQGTDRSTVLHGGAAVL